MSPLRKMLAALAGAVLAALHPAHAADAKPRVIGWVPAYALDAAMRGLQSRPEVGALLTHIGLQLWNPSADGRGLVFAPVDSSGKAVTAADVKRFRQWGQARGIPVLLTVYNNSQVMAKWDWPLARRAFAEHRGEFIRALLAEMETHGLDGIDVDLEGEGDHDIDRAAYADFIRELSAVLKPRGKLLSVDSFHSPCDNAPNMSWWADWVGRIDAVHSMGYADLYEGNNESFTPPGRTVCEGGAQLFKYSRQLRYGLKAGYRADQIVLGLPTWVDSWGSGGLGSTAAAHVREVQALGAGIALWDLQLAAPGWTSRETWDAVRELRRGK